MLDVIHHCSTTRGLQQPSRLAVVRLFPSRHHCRDLVVNNSPVVTQTSNHHCHTKTARALQHHSNAAVTRQSSRASSSPCIPQTPTWPTAASHSRDHHRVSGMWTHLHFSATAVESAPSAFLPPPRQPRNLRAITHGSQTLMERLPWQVAVSQWTIRKLRLVNQSTLARIWSTGVNCLCYAISVRWFLCRNLKRPTLERIVWRLFIID